MSDDFKNFSSSGSFLLKKKNTVNDIYALQTKSLYNKQCFTLNQHLMEGWVDDLFCGKVLPPIWGEGRERNLSTLRKTLTALRRVSRDEI